MGDLRVAVVGAGLGGLCLAQGLLRAGVDVVVYERDAALDSRRQGYRLHVDARAGLALQRCLPAELLSLFLATCGEPGRRFTVLSDRLRRLHEVVGDPSADSLAPGSLSTSVNRQTLREVLATGLADRIRYGSELTRYTASDSGVSLSFADGSTADADLLVGADGVNSVVRRQYLPDASVVDTGARCIYGKTLLDDAVLGLLPSAMFEGFTAIVGGPVGMASGLVRFRQPPADFSLTPFGDYLMWAVVADVGRFRVGDPGLSALDAAGLHELASSMIRNWHPDLRELVRLGDVDETFLIRIRTSVPVPAWTPTRVTLLGDAIHAMSPARGSGANTALQDAGVLCRELTSSSDLLSAVGAYEAEMRDYGFAAVEASRRGEAEAAASSWGNRLAFRIFSRFAGAGRSE